MLLDREMLKHFAVLLLCLVGKQFIINRYPHKGAMLLYIQSSNVGMRSSRRYSQSQASSSTLHIWGKGPDFIEQSKSGDNVSRAKKDGESKVYGGKENGKQFSDELFNRFQTSRPLTNVANIRPLERIKQLSKMREHTMNYLLNLLLGKNKYNDSNNFLSTMGTEQQFGGEYYQEFYYNEEEEMSFSTQGTVKTSDGREINFNVDLTMSRSFTEYSSQYIDFGAPKLMDPLVINLDLPAADVTDQKFYFDLDADGHDEQISQLAAGSGYLALDKNGDGTINDGTELFGTTSGNGFADLAAYDNDGNGWIDEADEILDKLLIWRKDASGRDELVGLGKAGVGAIYLGSSDTQFSLTNQRNETNAVIRQSGVFLYENGNVGSIQQLDLAT